MVIGFRCIEQDCETATIHQKPQGLEPFLR